MRSVDRSFENPLQAPNLILVGPDGIQIASTESLYPVDDTTLAAELPADGAYILTATREGGTIGASYGEFTLRLLLPEVVPDEAPLTQTISDEDGTAYFSLRAPEAFSLLYTRDGDYAPEIRVGHIETGTGRVAPDAVLSGTLATRTELGIFAPDTAYVIVITPNSWGFEFEPVTAIISLRRVVIESD
jgi:hypothetical protein